jgi:ABC-type bacteriocin/lantibiotic exporter with double-glycine peptidase domain
LYHPLFIFFGVLIVAIVAIIFYVTGKPAMESNIESSKYKYRVAYWIEELARSLHTFKLAGNTALPMSKMDMLLNGYLTYRQKHFKILVKQFKAMIAFKTFITAGLLVLGSVLVVNRQISLGQFVAAEIIILLVIASVEKLISILETVYDLLTAVDKVGHITDIPLERLGGTDLKKVNHSFGIELKNISYTYPHAHGSQALKNINLSITEGEKICVCGFNGSGKTTLLKMLSGLYPEYKGHFSINGLAFSSLKLESYRMMVSDNFSDQDLFEGTLLENITLGKKQASPSEVITLASRLGLSDFIASLPDGIETHLEAGAPLFSKSVKEKILIARSLMESPKLMLIDEFFYNSEQKEKERILNEIFAQPSAMVIISNDENIMKRCSKVILMKEGSIAHQGDAHSIKSYLQ